MSRDDMVISEIESVIGGYYIQLWHVNMSSGYVLSDTLGWFSDTFETQHISYLIKWLYSLPNEPWHNTEGGWVWVTKEEVSMYLIDLKWNLEPLVTSRFVNATIPHYVQDKNGNWCIQ